MSKSITQHFIVIRILIILGLLSQQVLIPLELFASTAQPSSSLVRGFTEDVDTYLQRVATTQPDLFQQAALAAVQQWNARKEKLMRPAHVEAAWEHLAEQGWITVPATV